MTLYEVIERIRIRAAELSPNSINDSLQDSEVIAEVILPRCLEIVTKDTAMNSEDLNALRRDHSISFTSGVADLPENIKEEYSESIIFPELDSVRQFQPPPSYRKTWTDYTVTTKSVIPTFTVKDKKIYFRNINSRVDAYTGTLTINAVTTPQLPVQDIDDVDIKDNILEKAITLAAEVISGKITLPFVDYISKEK